MILIIRQKLYNLNNQLILLLIFSVCVFWYSSVQAASVENDYSKKHSVKHYKSEILIGADLSKFNQINSSIACGNKSCLVVFENHQSESYVDINGQFFDFDTSNINIEVDDPSSGITLSRRYLRFSGRTRNECKKCRIKYEHLVARYEYNFPIADGNHMQKNPYVLSDGRNNYLIVWEEDGRIYGQLIESLDYKADYELSCEMFGIDTDSECICSSDFWCWNCWDKCMKKNWIYMSKLWQYRFNRFKFWNNTFSESTFKTFTQKIDISSVMKDNSNPVVSFDGINYLVIWEGGTVGNKNIYGQFISTSGRKELSIPFVVSSGTRNVENPSVTFDGMQYFVAWQGMSDAMSSIYGQIVSKSGQTLLSNPVIISSGTQNDENPSVAFDGKHYFAVWQGMSADGSSINGQLVSKSGQTVLNNPVVISSGTQNDENPSVAFDGTLYLVVLEVVWKNWTVT